VAESEHCSRRLRDDEAVIASSGRITFRLLGTLEVWTGQDWARISAAKQRALLATLLLHPGQPVSNDTLIDEIWPDGAPARATNVISVHIYHLRRLIGDPEGHVLVTRAPGYQVALQPGELDSDLFARQAAEGRHVLAGGNPEHAVSLLTAALELWRGRALGDLPRTQRITDEAGRLEEARIEAQELLAEATMACGRYAQAVPDLRRLVSECPLRESSWALLIRALFGAGRQAEALEAYELARTTIADELGVDPGPELQQLYQQILKSDGDQDAVPIAPLTLRPTVALVPAQLPAGISDFTGRSEQVEQLSGLLSGTPSASNLGAVRVALVVAAGGLGKTALAVHVAHQLAAEFPDGQLYVNLRGATQPMDPSEVLARLLRDLGADGAHIPLGEEERAAQYRTRLAGKRVLIVLDDARDAAQVRPLLPGTATCAVLVTSRNWLAELVGSLVVDLEVLTEGEASALFTRIVGESRVLAEPAATDAVLAVCGGLPLAIRIAGARLATRRNWSVSILAARLSDEQRRLDELQVGELAIRASFEVSFATLPGRADPGGVAPARAFRLLGLWTAPSISLAAASALLGVADDAVADALDVLVDAHLLEAPAPDRYRFHDLLRVYAADRARTQEPAGDRLAAVTRLLTWYLHTTEAAAVVISPQHIRVPLGSLADTIDPGSFSSLDEALAWCDSERAGLTSATRLAAAAGLHELAWKLPAAAMSFYYRRSHWDDLVTTHEAGLASARELGDRQAESWMLNNLGMAYGARHLEESVECFEQALALCRELGDLRGEARAANNLAHAHLVLGRFEQALETAQLSLVIQRHAGLPYGEGLALSEVGRCCVDLGRFADATDYLLEALRIFRGLGSRHAEADSLSDLGEAYLRLGELDQAVARLQESLAIRREIGDRQGQGETLRLLGHAQLRVGNPKQARTLFAEALRLFEELGDRAETDKTQADLAAATEDDG
jgi:DNA-binding SARP family transcriptional activator